MKIQKFQKHLGTFAVMVRVFKGQKGVGNMRIQVMAQTTWIKLSQTCNYCKDYNNTLQRFLDMFLFCYFVVLYVASVCAGLI